MHQTPPTAFHSIKQQINHSTLLLSATQSLSAGTYIVEFDQGKAILDEVLSSVENVNKAVEKLVQIAKTCQFEGWLMNIECQVDKLKVPMLQ